MTPMPSPIFIDTHIPIYAAGRPHPLREPCVEILSLVVATPHRFVTNAEVFQELLHRYLSIDGMFLGQEIIRSFGSLMHGRIEPIYGGDVLNAASLVSSTRRLGSRGRPGAGDRQRRGSAPGVRRAVGLALQAASRARDPWPPSPIPPSKCLAGPRARIAARASGRWTAPSHRNPA